MRRRWYREMLDEMREEHRLYREDLERRAEEGRRRDEEGRRRDEELRRRAREHRAELQALRADQKRRFDAIDSAMENDRRVTREIILELREGRAILRDMRHGIQANTEGLLRVLDEFRRDGGSAAAGA